MRKLDREICELRLGTYYRWRLLGKKLLTLSGKTILDVGCNYGLFVERLSERNIAVGIETDGEAAAGAKKRNPALNLVLAGGCAIPLRNATVEYVICLSVIEHIADDSGAISEISRVLKPGGVLTLTTTHENFKLLSRPVKGIAKAVNKLCKTSFPTSDEEYVHFGQEGIGHVRTGYSREGIRQLLEDHGLKMEYFDSYWCPATRLAYPPLMLLLRYRIVPRALVCFLFNIAIGLDRWIKDEKGDMIVRARKGVV